MVSGDRVDSIRTEQATMFGAVSILINAATTTIVFAPLPHVSLSISGEDALGFTPQGSITGRYDSLNGVLTLSRMATLPKYKHVGSSDAYVNPRKTQSAAIRTETESIDESDAENNLTTPNRGISRTED